MKDRSSGWTALALAAIPALGLAALVFDPTGFPFWRGGAYSDLLVSHWPISAFIRYSILTWRQIPLWNPLILSGMPLAADPLAGLWYLPNIVGWALPGGLGFNLLFWAHLGLAAWGVVKLLRSEGASAPAAVLGGVGVRRDAQAHRSYRTGAPYACRGSLLDTLDPGCSQAGNRAHARVFRPGGALRARGRIAGDDRLDRPSVDHSLRASVPVIRRQVPCA